MNLTPLNGRVVRFKEKVFHPPFAPYYDKYKGHTFVVMEIIEGNHAVLQCTDNEKVKVDGNVHLDELELAR